MLDRANRLDFLLELLVHFPLENFFPSGHVGCLQFCIDLMELVEELLEVCIVLLRLILRTNVLDGVDEGVGLEDDRLKVRQ